MCELADNRVSPSEAPWGRLALKRVALVADKPSAPRETGAGRRSCVVPGLMAERPIRVARACPRTRGISSPAHGSHAAGNHRNDAVLRDRGLTEMNAKSRGMA